MKGLKTIVITLASFFTLFLSQAHAVVLVYEDFETTSITDGTTVSPTANLNTWVGYRWDTTLTGCNSPCSNKFAGQNITADGDQTNLLVYAIDSSAISIGTMMDISLDFIESSRNGKLFVFGMNNGVHEVDPFAPWLTGEGDASDGIVFLEETLGQTGTWTSAGFSTIVTQQFDAIGIGIMMGGSDGIRGVDNILWETKDVPEPATLSLLGLGLLGLGLVRRKHL